MTTEAEQVDEGQAGQGLADQVEITDGGEESGVEYIVNLGLTRDESFETRCERDGRKIKNLYFLDVYKVNDDIELHESEEAEEFKEISIDELVEQGKIEHVEQIGYFGKDCMMAVLVDVVNGNYEVEGINIEPGAKVHVLHSYRKGKKQMEVETMTSPQDKKEDEASIAVAEEPEAGYEALEKIEGAAETPEAEVEGVRPGNEVAKYEPQVPAEAVQPQTGVQAYGAQIPVALAKLPEGAQLDYRRGDFKGLSLFEGAQSVEDVAERFTAGAAVIKAASELDLLAAGRRYDVGRFSADLGNQRALDAVRRRTNVQMAENRAATDVAYGGRIDAMEASGRELGLATRLYGSGVPSCLPAERN